MSGMRGGIATDRGTAAPPEEEVDAERRRESERPQARAAAPARRPLLGLASDPRLVKYAKRGDREAFEAIFRRYERDLYRFCAGILGEPQDAQDALQNTMIKVMRALPGERREVKLKPWLYRVAHNEAIDVQRRRRRTDPLEAAIVDWGTALDERAEQQERLRKLFEDMADLPRRQRATLVMRELNGLEFGEIGAALDTSPGAARQALYEARRGLQRMREGREMRCEEVSRLLSDGDGSSRGRRDVRAHLRECADCRRFQAEIADRKQAFAAISPLPAIAAAALAKSVLGGASGAGLGGVGAAGGGAVATSVGLSGVVKSVAGVLAVVAIGTVAAERGGLIPVGADHRSPAADRHAAAREPGVAPAAVSGRGPLVRAHGAPAAAVVTKTAGSVGVPRSLGPDANADRPQRGPAIDPATAREEAAKPVSPNAAQAHGKHGGNAQHGTPAAAADHAAKTSPARAKHPEHPEQAAQAAPGHSRQAAHPHPAKPTHPAHPSHPEKPRKAKIASEPAAAPVVNPPPVRETSAAPALPDDSHGKPSKPEAAAGSE
jgi:RNA polymerase sigma factor (sigma-70 family)